MIPQRRRTPSDGGRGVSLGDPLCEHNYPIMVTATYAGYYARCLRCNAKGPERPSDEAARKALLVLGAWEVGATT